MLLLIVFIIVIISIALLFSLFSSFLPFMQRYGDIAEHTTAYYWALSSIERAVQVTRYQGAGFTGEVVANWADLYHYGSLERNKSAWSVNSLVKSIPSEWEGNIESTFNDGWKNSGYNALNYNISEIIPLGKVEIPLPAAYYSGNKVHNINIPNFSFKLKLRLNPFLKSKFWTDSSLDEKLDRVIASWTIKGSKNNDLNNSEYTLLPLENVQYSTYTVNTNQDTMIRASRINGDDGNNGTTMTFAGNGHPFDSNATLPLNIISNIDESWVTFSNAFLNTKNGQLNLWLTNLLSTFTKFYPFLEYRIDFNGQNADRFYTIKGEGKVGNYHVRLQLKKPTLPQPLAGNFTIVF